MKKSSLISTLLSTLTIIALSSTITGCGSSNSTEPKVVVDGVEYNLLTLTQQQIQDILLNFSLEQLTELVNKVEAMYSEALDKYSDSISDLAKEALDNVKALLAQKQALVDAQNEADRKKAQEEADAKAAELAANVKALAAEAQKVETPPSVKEEVKKVVAVIDPKPQETNEAPVANADAATTAYETAVTVDVLANDTDANGDTLSVSGIATAPANGTAVIDGNGNIEYTPNPGFSGPDTFQYTTTDGAGAFTVGNVTITVKGEVITDNPTIFDLEVKSSGPTSRYIEGVASDLDGANKAETFYNNSNVPEGTYTDDDNDGRIDINNEPFYDDGTPYSVKFTDDLGNERTETGTL